MPSIVRDVHVENLLSGRRMLIEWSLNDITEGITTYQVWRSTQEYQGYTMIAELNSPSTQYVDQVPYTFGVVFFYKVLAKNASGILSDITQSNAVQDSTFDDFEERPFRSTTLQFDALVVGEVPTGAVDGVRTQFTVANLFRFNTLQVFVNGINRTRGTDFSEDAGQKSFTFSAAPAANSIVIVNYLKL